MATTARQRRGRGGRPSKLTPDVQQRLVEAISAGNYYEAACAYAGIGYSTFRRWMQMGERAKRGKYREFWEAITRAERLAEARIVAQWQAHMPNDYRACRDFLAARFPERWGRRETVNVNAHVRSEHQETVVRREEYVVRVEAALNDPEIREIARELWRRTVGGAGPDPAGSVGGGRAGVPGVVR